MSGGLHLLSLLLLVAAWWAYAAFAAALGLWFSLRSRTTLRATGWTLVTLLVVGTGLPLFWVLFLPIAVWLQKFFLIDPDWAYDFSSHGLAPPITLFHLAFPYGDRYTFARETVARVGGVGLAWVGVCIYALAAVVLYQLTRARFGALTGRMS
jgi:hypothetical protein